MPPHIRLYLLPPLTGADLPGERRLLVSVYEGGETRGIGYLDVPEVAVPQLGALGVLVALGVFASLEFEGKGAPEVLTLDERTVKLIKLAGKVLR